MTPQQPELFKVLIPTKYIALSDNKKRELAPLQYAKVFLFINKKGENVMGIFSEELKILDRNTVQLMIDEMQDTINAQQNTIDSQQDTIDSQRDTIDSQQDTIDSQNV